MTIIPKYKAEKLLKSLPITYYAGRTIEVKMVEGGGTKFDRMSDIIYIDYNMLVDIMQNEHYDESFLEEDVRCFFYHELSHALLTPSELRMTSVVNVFEDERIESLLRYYYMNVDFRSFVKRVNNFKNEAPDSAWSMYYQVVRYRIGPSEFVKRVHDIIVQFKNYSFDTNDTYYYKLAIDALYNDIVDYWNRKEEEEKEEDNANETDASNETNDGTNDIDEETEETEENEEDEENAEAGENEESEETDDTYSDADIEKDEQDEYDESFIDKQVKHSFNVYENQTIANDVERILASLKVTEKNNGSAINAYSGVFNPRSVVRNDYKWFVQQNRLGHVRAYSKLKLNLFIDCSGSFSNNDKIVNMLLKALTRFEKTTRDFSFDLISCEDDQTIRAKNDRVQHSCGGTCLRPSIIQQYASVQQPDAQNINIVLYDGDMFCSADSKDEIRRGLNALKTFDNNHCILIVDDENEEYVTKYCTHAKCIITKNYVDELYKNIIQTLTSLVR